eukprot:CAMPEP_0113889348 /NCGR_PEP_ID=MMETSP0780_2-20120614/13434_1 /TAXON_ID=652834 /ORGANISM="Palpitomonas bilix" /LENGTH=430 /DNA_ID=CAMNT_0000878411 /DNA_START=185 /DNA_END=1474 /DNA_ORIENTATION=+ /assembly_acc=CAM_ASM_000599
MGRDDDSDSERDRLKWGEEGRGQAGKLYAAGRDNGEPLPPPYKFLNVYSMEQAAGRLCSLGAVSVVVVMIALLLVVIPLFSFDIMDRDSRDIIDDYRRAGPKAQNASSSYFPPLGTACARVAVKPTQSAGLQDGSYISSLSSSSGELSFTVQDRQYTTPIDPRFEGLFNNFFKLTGAYGGYQYCEGQIGVAIPDLQPVYGKIPRLLLAYTGKYPSAFVQNVVDAPDASVIDLPFFKIAYDHAASTASISVISRIDVTIASLDDVVAPANQASRTFGLASLLPPNTTVTDANYKSLFGVSSDGPSIPVGVYPLVSAVPSFDVVRTVTSTLMRQCEEAAATNSPLPSSCPYRSAVGQTKSISVRVLPVDKLDFEMPVFQAFQRFFFGLGLLIAGVAIFSSLSCLCIAAYSHKRENNDQPPLFFASQRKIRGW